MHTITVMSRRSMLKLLSVATAVPSALVSTAAYAGQGENPDFISAVHNLGIALARFDDTLDAKTRAMAYFDSIAPEVPAEIRAINPHLSEQGYGSPFGVAERLQDGDCQDVRRDNRPVYVLVSWGLAKQVGRSDGRTAKGKEDRRLHRIAQAYEVAVAQARNTANLEALREAHYWADDTVRNSAMALAKAEATTMRGALLKVQGWMAAGSRQVDIRHQSWAPRVILENVATVLAGAA